MCTHIIQCFKNSKKNLKYLLSELIIDKWGGGDNIRVNLNFVKFNAV